MNNITAFRYVTSTILLLIIIFSYHGMVTNIESSKPLESNIVLSRLDSIECIQNAIVKQLAQLQESNSKSILALHEMQLKLIINQNVLASATITVFKNHSDEILKLKEHIHDGEK